MAGIFSVAHAQTHLSSDKQTLKILSWNIYMLPGFLGYGKDQRAEAIGRMLSESEYDVIVFQEAFDHSARKIINRHLQPVFCFEARPENEHKLSLRTNSGLWILSRHPIMNQSSIEFENRQGVDAMARKGALLVELDARGYRIQIVGTHLQNSDDHSLKQNQCAELFNKLLQKNQRHGVPQIICGDFNIDQHTMPDQYEQILNTLQVQNQVSDSMVYSYDRSENDLQIEHGDTRELIDFIFIRDNRALVECTARTVKRFRYPWSASHHDLSDHYSIEATLHVGYPVNETIISAQVATRE